MATLQQIQNLKPRAGLSKKAVPRALHEALHVLFRADVPDAWLVGGTALAGYYAEHRRSDDLDLFAVTPAAFMAMVRQMDILKKKGAVMSQALSTPGYYHSLVDFKGHAFTLDIVLDENLGHVGKSFQTGDRVRVASLDTLLLMKAACLVSRCSEKDLFDLDWILSQSGEMPAAELIACGQKIDAGMTAEALLISLGGALLKKESCNFLLPDSPITINQAYQKVTRLRKKILKLFLDYEKNQVATPAAQTLKNLKKFQDQIS